MHKIVVNIIIINTIATKTFPPHFFTNTIAKSNTLIPCLLQSAKLHRNFPLLRLFLHCGVEWEGVVFSSSSNRLSNHFV